MGNSNPVLIITSGVILLAVLAGIFVLTWHGTITGGEAITMAASIVGLAGGAFAVHTGVKANSASAPPVATVITPTQVSGEE